MANSKEHREFPHCPKCKDDVVLEFPVERVDVQGRSFVFSTYKLKCPTCGNERTGFDRVAATAWATKHATGIPVGHVQHVRLKREAHRFKRFEHLGLKYDARDYFYYPRLGGEEHDGFLCPVFFDKDVLVYFNNHPKYRLVMRSSSAGSIMQGDEPLLSHGFGVNRSGKLFMWLGDIGRALSDPSVKRELDIYKAHNVDSDHDLASTYFFSQNPGSLDEAFFESDNESQVFKLVDEISEAFKTRFGEPLIKVDIDRLAEAYRLPVLEDRPQVFQAFMSLNINLVENMDQAVLKRALVGNGLRDADMKGRDGKTFRGNKLLQLLLERVLGDTQASATMMPLFVVNDLRQLHGHLSDASFEEDYTKYKATLALPATATDLEVHARLIELLIRSLSKIKELLATASIANETEAVP